MYKNILRWGRSFFQPLYVIFFVTNRCNAGCPMCFYAQNMQKSLPDEKELTVEEYECIARKMKTINVLGISGGEPFLRQDLPEILHAFYRNASPLVVDLPTNGYFTETITRHVERIASQCPKMILDLQLSIDGPEEIHNAIRKLPDGFKKLEQTYDAMIALKNRYKNLRIKACIVYSAYNKNHIRQLFRVLDEKFSRLDRIVFSVVHGTTYNPEALRFEWSDYFKECKHLRSRSRVHNIFDFHSIFTMALRITKNHYLKKSLIRKDFFRVCKAGKRVVVVSPTGTVFPCEPLWEEVGNLRTNNYDLKQIIHSPSMAQFQQKIKNKSCNCHWGIPMTNALLYSPRYYPRIAYEASSIFLRSITKEIPAESSIPPE